MFIPSSFSSISQPFIPISSVHTLYMLCTLSVHTLYKIQRKHSVDTYKNYRKNIILPCVQAFISSASGQLQYAK